MNVGPLGRLDDLLHGDDPTGVPESYVLSHGEVEQDGVLGDYGHLSPDPLGVQGIQGLAVYQLGETERTDM